jgi:hypothetical protein
MKVKLSHARNPDIGGYWEEPIDPAKAKWVHVDTFKQASEVCRAFIARNFLGCGNWTGGQIRNDANRTIAYVSYNGRVWDEYPFTLESKEIKI